MTTPYERTRALLQTKQFLHRLASLGDDAIPLSMQIEAEALLRHYPGLVDIEAAHTASPDVFGPLLREEWDSFLKDGPAVSDDFEK